MEQSNPKMNRQPVPEMRSSNQNQRITESTFRAVTDFLKLKYGLRIAPEKKVMIESRLLKHLGNLGIDSFEAYFERVFHGGDRQEYDKFIDLVTTHKTFFFREDYQFEYLQKAVSTKFSNGQNSFDIWSAGCSTGEEVYTIGMVMNEMRGTRSTLNYKIIGTDIAVPSLRQASAGIFRRDDVEALPAEFQTRYFVQQDDTYMRFAHAEVRARVRLGILNLNNPVYNLSGMFDFIFCRNVIIYFDAATQREVLGRLVSKLKPGGYLMLGHSETAIGATLPIRNICPTIYQKTI